MPILVFWLPLIFLMGMCEVVDNDARKATPVVGAPRHFDDLIFNDPHVFDGTPRNDLRSA
jgi:hypothetical protein